MRTLVYLMFGSILWAASLEAASIDFIQNGWEPGGSLLASFSGADDNANGTLEQPELTSFDVNWITPFGNFTKWTIHDIEPGGFLFADLDNYLFFVRNADFSLVSTAFEGEALASVFDQFLFPVSSSATSPTAVPEPSGFGVLGLVALGIYGWRTKNEKQMP